MEPTETHEITATSYGGPRSGTVDFTVAAPVGAEPAAIEALARERAQDELRDSGYRTGPVTLQVDGREL